MTTPMTKRERLEATFAGEAVDRPPVALWRHWPVDDQYGDQLARASLDFQRTYDFDFINQPEFSPCLPVWKIVSYIQISQFTSFTGKLNLMDSRSFR